MDKKWKVTLAFILVYVVFLASIFYIFILQSHPEPDSGVYTSFSGEIDTTAIVSWVIDGDTFDTTSEGRIRLADIDAPEEGESGYYDAKNFLFGLVYNKQVYLDIDDVFRTDKYGRLVCVAYVNHNSTHLVNVNKALLVKGFAIISNYENEFNPHIWSYYNKAPTELPSPPEEQSPPPASPTYKFVGSRKSNVYHYPSCYWAKKIKPENKIWFTSSADARAHGYRPCKVCNPP